MYNILLVDQWEGCPQCGLGTTRYIQFGYGALILKEYRVGDKLEWGSLDRGEPGIPHVAVFGTGLSCVDCNYDYGQDYRIDIKYDVIARAELDDGKLDYLSQGNHYWLILEK